MNDTQQSLDALKDIRNIMNKSSRFNTLSGLSGIASGICALAGAWWMYLTIRKMKEVNANLTIHSPIALQDAAGKTFLELAIVVFFLALVLSFFFTWLRNRNTSNTIWNAVTQRIVVSITVPLLAGGMFVVQLMQIGALGMIAPACLLFYGLGLLNASKYTLKEVRYLAYVQIGIGVVSIFLPDYGLYLWALGFGVAHVLYGVYIWYRYERIIEEAVS